MQFGLLFISYIISSVRGGALAPLNALMPLPDACEGLNSSQLDPFFVFKTLIALELEIQKPNV